METIEGLDVNLDAENLVEATAFFADPNLPPIPVTFNIESGAIPNGTNLSTFSLNSITNNLTATNNVTYSLNVSTNNVNGTSGDDDISLKAFEISANGFAGNDRIDANNLNNLLDGGDGNDTIFAYGGDDLITISDTGQNDINGGDGVDTVIYSGNKTFANISISELGTSSVLIDIDDILVDVEYIQFYDVSNDTIVIFGSGFDSGLPTVILSVNQFVIETSAGDNNDRFIYNPNNGKLLFDIDGNDAINSIQIASLDTGLGLTNQDILII